MDDIIAAIRHATEDTGIGFSLFIKDGEYSARVRKDEVLLFRIDGVEDLVDLKTQILDYFMDARIVTV